MYFSYLVEQNAKNCGPVFASLEHSEAPSHSVDEVNFSDQGLTSGFCLEQTFMSKEMRLITEFA
jgi:hypothetical protein